MSKLRRLIAVGITILLFALLLSHPSVRALPEHLVEIRPGLLFGVIVALLFSYFLRAARIAQSFPTSHFPQSAEALAGSRRILSFLGVTLMHNALVNVMPFRSGEAALPLLLRDRFGIGLADATAALVWMRLQDAVIVCGLALLIWPGLYLPLRIALLLALAGTLLGLPALLHRLALRQESAQSPRESLALPIGRRLRTALERFVAGQKRAPLANWAWTLANWSVKFAAQATLLSELAHVSWGSGFVGALGGEGAAILPIQGVAGFGTYEAGVALFLVPQGVLTATALQAALLLHLLGISVAVIAGALAALFSGSFPSLFKRHQRTVPPPNPPTPLQ